MEHKRNTRNKLTKKEIDRLYSLEMTFIGSEGRDFVTSFTGGAQNAA